MKQSDHNFSSYPVSAKILSMPVPSKFPILISILNWNAFDETAACLDSLHCSEDVCWDCIVIDNGSLLDPADHLEGHYPDVYYLRLDSNLGFTGGHNIAIKLAIECGYQAVILLNNDCRVSPFTISSLVKTMQSRPEIGALSPCIYCVDQENRAQAVGGWLDWSQHKAQMPSSPSEDHPVDYPAFLPGTALLLKCSMLEEIGALDERYFAYYEDSELCARLARSDYEACYAHDTVVYHKARSIFEYSDMAHYLSSRNQWLFWRENTPKPYRSGLFLNILAQQLYIICILKKSNSPSGINAVVAGFWDAQFGKFGSPPAAAKAPYVLVFIARIAPYYLSSLITSPLLTVKSTLRRVLRLPKFL
jgi:GT2 family glycosyltransferase